MLIVVMLCRYFFLGGRENRQRTPPAQSGTEGSVRILLTSQLSVSSVAPCQRRGSRLNGLRDTGRGVLPAVQNIT